MGVFSHWYILLLILAIVLIVYGPGKLPEVGGAIGRAMREFRKASSDLQDEIKKSTTDQPEPPTHPASNSPATDVKSPTDTKAS
jgi:sec-independent protein translocase protein TatA